MSTHATLSFPAVSKGGFRLLSLARTLAIRHGYRAAVLCIIAFGLWLRLRLFLLNPPFWLDETFWLSEMLERPLEKLYVRPIGFMWVSKELAGWLGVTERTLRFWTTLASVGTLLLAKPLLTKLVTSRITVLVGTLLFAIHPWYLDYGVEFKPYAVELFLHLFLLWGCLKELERPFSTLKVAAFFLIATAGFLLGYNTLFAYPAVYSLFLVRTMNSNGLARAERFQRTAILVLFSLLSLALILWVRSTALKPVVEIDESQYWANKYDVFIKASGNSAEARLDWFVDKYLSFTEAPALLREWQWDKNLWSPATALEVGALSVLAWGALHWLGLFRVAQRRGFWVFALLLGPTAVAVAFNLAGKWPFGLFRTNLFLTGYFMLIGLVGADVLMTLRRPFLRTLSLILVLALIIPALLTAAQGRERKSWSSPNTPLAIEILDRLSKRPALATGRILILSDAYTFTDIQVYTKHHTTLRLLYPELLSKRYLLVRGSRLKDIVGRLKRIGQGPVVVMIGRAADLPKAREELAPLCPTLEVFEEVEEPFLALCLRGP